MSLLILGGTADARKLTEKLHMQGLALTYSVAGLVRTPDVPCDVVSGGFSQFGGLTQYLKQRLDEQKPITAILDVTHPYAEKMSATAVLAAKQLGIPCWRFHRPPWDAKRGDHWQIFKSWETLLPLLVDKQSVFFTAGQLDEATILTLDALLKGKKQRQLLRTAVKPKVTMLESMDWIKAIGPFEYQQELELMKAYKVDVLVSKNSGGDSTDAKLYAARELGIPVFMLARPPIADADRIFDDLLEYERFVLSEVTIK